MASIHIGCDNAKEVTPHNKDNDCFEKHGEDECLFGLLGVSIGWDVTHAGVERVFLVNPYEVDQIPNLQQRN